MNIINTIAEVFRISGEEFRSIMQFVMEEERDGFNNPLMVVIDTGPEADVTAKSGPFVVFLRIESVNLIFLKCFCEGTTLLNGLPIVCSRVYLFAPGSYVQSAPSPSIYYSDILAHFVSGRIIHRISFVADRVNYLFPDGAPAITNVSFQASGECLWELWERADPAKQPSLTC